MSRWRRGFVTSLLFPAPPPSYTIDSFPGELIWVPKGPVQDSDAGGSLSSESSESAPCLLLPYESARFLIIFFHSNAEDLGRCRWFCLFLRDQFQVHVLAVEYPGYGVCPGTTSREAIMANAHAALQFATQALKLPLDRVKLFGRSIGTGPTLALASKFKVAGVVLVTPFLSVRTLFREKVGPLAMMIEEWFDNDEAVKQVKSPTMIIHGRKDVLIPCLHGETLYNSCPTRKLFINPQLMEHNTNLTSDISYLIVPMFRFFALPDYSFTELQIPSWAYDKRRSPLYVRPDAQVTSNTLQVDLRPDQGARGAMCVPLGDDADAPVDEDQAIADDQDLTGGGKSGGGGKALADAEKPLTVLTHPTVLHSYSATKQRYLFQDPNGKNNRTDAGAPAAVPEKGDEVPIETIRPLKARLSTGRPNFQLNIERRSALGSHSSATKPSSVSPGPSNGAVGGRQPARGASSGMAYTEVAFKPPSYDGDHLRNGKDAVDLVPMLSQLQPTSDEELSDQFPDAPWQLVQSNTSVPAPRVATKLAAPLAGEVLPGVSYPVTPEKARSIVAAIVGDPGATASAPVTSAKDLTAAAVTAPEASLAVATPEADKEQQPPEGNRGKPWVGQSEV